VTTRQMQREVVDPLPTSVTGGAWFVAELLWQKRSLLVKVGVLGCLVSLGIAFVIPKQYESTVRLMPPDTQSMAGSSIAAAVLGNLPSATANLSGSMLGLKSQGALFVGVLQSRTIQDNLINRFDLRKVYGKKRYVDTRTKLANRTAINEDTKSGIVTVTVTDNDPGRAQALAAGYLDELNAVMAQVSTSSARRERIFLEERLKRVKRDLDEATLRLSEFSSKNMTFDPDLQGKAMLDAAAALEGQLVAAESELSGLEQIYGAQNSRVKAEEARVADLRRKVQSMSGRGSKPNNDGGNPQGLTSSELYPSLEQLPLLGNTYIDLARRAKIDESVYEVLTKQYELAKVQEAKEIPTVKVLDAADYPEKKSFPPRTLMGIAGGLLAFAGAILWQLTKAYWQMVDDHDPRKGFVRGVLHSAPWQRRRALER